MNKKSINTLVYNPELCIGCEMCWIVCPHNVFAKNGGKAEIIHKKACIECGACQINCPTGAIKVNSGTGCASAMMKAALTGREPSCCECK
jgi:NAD-dependent dihydropyrimidine dehydrogenase PreA subunit